MRLTQEQYEQLIARRRAERGETQEEQPKSVEFVKTNGKFNNTKVIVDGQTFDSKREYKHFCMLKNHFFDVKAHGEDIELVPGKELVIDGKAIKIQNIDYRPDFYINQNGHTYIFVHVFLPKSVVKYLTLKKRYLSQ